MPPLGAKGALREGREGREGERRGRGRVDLNKAVGERTALTAISYSRRPAPRAAAEAAAPSSRKPLSSSPSPAAICAVASSWGAWSEAAHGRKARAIGVNSPVVGDLARSCAGEPWRTRTSKSSPIASSGACARSSQRTESGRARRSAARRGSAPPFSPQRQRRSRAPSRRCSPCATLAPRALGRRKFECSRRTAGSRRTARASPPLQGRREPGRRARRTTALRPCGECPALRRRKRAARRRSPTPRSRRAPPPPRPDHRPPARRPPAKSAAMPRGAPPPRAPRALLSPPRLAAASRPPHPAPAGSRSSSPALPSSSTFPRTCILRLPRLLSSKKKYTTKSRPPLK